MNQEANTSVAVSRRLLIIGLVLAGLALLLSIVAAALLFSVTNLALLMPLPGTILFLGIFSRLLQEQTQARESDQTDAASVTNHNPEAVVGEPPDTAERTITVDEDREVYGLYATLQTISASLSPADTLNFISDRLFRLIPGATVVFALTDDATEPLSVTAKFGRFAHLFALGDAIADDEAISLARATRRAVAGFIRPNARTDDDPEAEPEHWPTIAAPVIFEGTVHGAIGLFRDAGRGFTESEAAQLESVALFASAGIHQAWTQRQSRDSALFDPVSNLPNLRAAHTIVDQRIAEALRHRTDEPLGLLCLRFAHPDVTDRQLRSLSVLVTPLLRHMDILTGGEPGELLVVLPRAGHIEATLVANRILRALANDPVASAAALCLGLASYPADGATSSELFSSARENSRKADGQAIDGAFDNVVLVDHWR